MRQSYGGNWTELKLGCLKKYLDAYMKIVYGKGFRVAYIDAFAGTGYREIIDEESGKLLFPELEESDSKSFKEGSIQKALAVIPPFDRYVFIEKSSKKCKELQKVVERYPDVKERVVIKNADANNYLEGICSFNWAKHRAVLFLDPFGMQVKWNTIKCIADTRAIDMWLLFPLGIGVSRLLKKNGEIKEIFRDKLDDIFGTKAWLKDFYKITVEETLFGLSEYTKKTADFDKIAKFFNVRLESIFSQVAKNPAKLLNSKNVPLFLLCFAAGNPKGAATAVRIAEDILKRI
ncbi:MAG: three-Cys-motif partner protein TcmP [Spirochaetales bacterium]|nr:three-Cys-motif partner protein TcmP [Spirochaetales bacterium]